MPVSRAIIPCLLALTAAACEDSLGPPPPEYAQYAFGYEVSYACSGWSPSQPAVALGLFDIIDGSSDPLAPRDRPSDPLLQEITSRGGIIAYSFNIPKVRAVLDPAVVPQLTANIVRGVRDPVDFTVKVFVRFRGGVINDRVVKRYGGKILDVYDQFGIVLAAVSDARLPALRADRRLEYVELAEWVLCLF